MDTKTIDHLCNLSKLNYSDEEKAKAIDEMSAIIELMDAVKEFNLTYDDTEDNNSIAYSEVRKDEAKPSFPTDELVINIKTVNNCYVVPKMVE